MANPGFCRSAWGLSKRIKISSPPQIVLSRACFSNSSLRNAPIDMKEAESSKIPECNHLRTHYRKHDLPLPFQKGSFLIVQNRKSIPPRSETINPRLPRAVQTIYLKPLRRNATYGVPACDLQLRSYSVRNLEFFADFALRAAYYLNLPASGPTPLPRIVERWTVPRASFVHKKSQENFERKTLRRLIQISDGHPDTVQIWLAYLKKHAYYAVGMKANVWEYEKLGVAKNMDASVEQLDKAFGEQFEQFGRNKGVETPKKILDILKDKRFQHGREGFLSRDM
ncbi:MAG: Tryptophan--tRNA ligase, mitochondrial [Cirrosporium novae-zelandiae]|nr:MAG: Tryptophan--tRNA ligase, mitochondrial [Cirrosporium novae-zelandiae]